MRAIKKGVGKGCARPRPPLCMNSLRDALVWACDFEHVQVDAAKALAGSLKWSFSTASPEVWSHFDAVQQLRHAAFFLDSSAFLGGRRLADPAHRQLLASWYGSWRAAALFSQLSRKLRLPTWQRRAQAKSGVGWAHAPVNASWPLSGGLQGLAQVHSGFRYQGD